jgi:hypothetical protein
VKLALGQRHGVTDDAIATSPSEDKTAATFRVAFLVRKRLRDGVIDNMVGH